MKLYHVGDIETLAGMLDARAHDCRERAARQSTATARREDLLAANVWESAANIVRQTEITTEPVKKPYA